MNNFGEKVSFIWSVADLIRGPYRPNQYKDVMLPMTVLRRLDCLLTPTKDKVLEQAGANTDKTKEILRLYERIKQEIPKIIRSQYGIQAIDTLFDRPIFQSTDFIRRSKIPKESAIRIINALKGAALIRDIRPGKGRRAAILIFPELITITERGR